MNTTSKLSDYKLPYPILSLRDAKELDTLHCGKTYTIKFSNEDSITYTHYNIFRVYCFIRTKNIVYCVRYNTYQVLKSDAEYCLEYVYIENNDGTLNTLHYFDFSVYIQYSLNLKPNKINIFHYNQKGENIRKELIDLEYTNSQCNKVTIKNITDTETELVYTRINKDDYSGNLTTWCSDTHANYFIVSNQNNLLNKLISLPSGNDSPNDLFDHEYYLHFNMGKDAFNRFFNILHKGDTKDTLRYFTENIESYIRMNAVIVKNMFNGSEKTDCDGLELKELKENRLSFNSHNRDL